MKMSKRALAQAAKLKEEQDKTTQQVSDILTAQAEDAQRKIQGATCVAMQTQQEVHTLSALAKTADLISKMTAEKMERQMEAVKQQMEESKRQAVQEAQMAKVSQDTITKQLLKHNKVCRHQFNSPKVMNSSYLH